MDMRGWTGRHPVLTILIVLAAISALWALTQVVMNIGTSDPAYGAEKRGECHTRALAARAIDQHQQGHVDLANQARRRYRDCRQHKGMDWGWDVGPMRNHNWAPAKTDKSGRCPDFEALRGGKVIATIDNWLGIKMFTEQMGRLACYRVDGTIDKVLAAHMHVEASDAAQFMGWDPRAEGEPGYQYRRNGSLVTIREADLRECVGEPLGCLPHHRATRGKFVLHPWGRISGAFYGLD